MSNWHRLAAVAFCSLAAVAAAVITAADRSPAGSSGAEPSERPDVTGERQEASGAEPGTGEPLFVDIAQVSKRIAASEDALRQALERRITVKFKDEPLEKAVARLAELSRARILLDDVSLRNEGIQRDERVSGEFENEPLAAVLDRLLGPDGLQWFLRERQMTWLIEHEAIVITAVYRSDGARFSKSYDVRPLFAAGFTEEQLVRLIQAETSESWEAVDGIGGTVKVWRGLALVRQSQPVHGEIESLLRDLVRVAVSDAQTGTIPLDRTGGPFQPRILEALGLAIEIDARDTALDQVVAQLSQQARIPIRIDRAALADEGFQPNQPVTLQVAGVTLQSALSLALSPLGLVVIAEEGSLVVTTIVCDEAQHSVIFVVRDFIEQGTEPEEIIDLLLSETSGPWDESDGTGGRIQALPGGLLLVRQTHTVLLEIPRLLDQLRGHADGLRPRPRRESPVRIQYYAIETLPIADVAQAIPKFVSPESWKVNGGRGEIAAVGKHLVIRQTPSLHRELREFLRELRSNTGSGPLMRGAW
jgi:hypothetical protein